MLVGTFLINNSPTIVLFDSGASHTFISKTYALQQKYSIHKIKQSYRITAPGAPIDTNLIVRGLRLSIGVEVFIINHVVLPHQGIDIILGMDWMTEHHALLDITDRTVQIRSSKSGKLIRIHLPTHKSLSHTVNTIEAQEIGEIPIVYEYPDVFPEELPGLPPDREVEFCHRTSTGHGTYLTEAIQDGTR